MFAKRKRAGLYGKTKVTRDWIGNNDTFGPRRVTSNTTGPEDVNEVPSIMKKPPGWVFGAPSLADYLGDRVRQVGVDGGIFDDGRVIDQISFNPDLIMSNADRNGSKTSSLQWHPRILGFI